MKFRVMYAPKGSNAPVLLDWCDWNRGVMIVEELDELGINAWLEG